MARKKLSAVLRDPRKVFLALYVYFLMVAFGDQVVQAIEGVLINGNGQYPNQALAEYQYHDPASRFYRNTLTLRDSEPQKLINLHLKQEEVSGHGLVLTDFNRDIYYRNQPLITPWNRRIRRNAPDNLKSLLDRSTAFARIINGVSLQSGLLSGTHKIEVAVGELLNFGSIKMAEVVGFKADKITALTSKLTDFKKEVKTGNEVKDQEKMFVELEKIMEESEGAKSLEISDGKYFSDVENVEQNFDIANMNKVARFVTDALNLVELLKTVPIENTKDIDDDWLKCVNVINHLNNYGLYTTAISTFHKYIQSVAHLETFPEVLEPYRTVIRLIEARAGLKTSGTEALQKNIGQFIELLKVSNSWNGEFSMIYRLIHSRANPVQMNREVTIGFLNGVTDFDRLLKDLQDPSFAKMIGEKKVKKLLDGLKPILSIQSKIDELNGKFGLFSKDSFLSTSQVQMLQVEMQGMSITDNDVDEVLKAIEIPADIDSAIYKAAKEVIKAAETFTEMIQSVRKWAEHLVGTELTEAIKAFDKDLNFKDRAKVDQSKAEIPAVMKNLKDKDSIKKFQDALTATQSLLNGYTGDSIKTGAASIKQDGLNTFKDEQVVRDELRFHGRLRDNKQKLVTIVEAIELIHRTQNLDSGEIQKLESLAKAIPDASKLLTAQHLKSIGESMKTAENLESKSLGQTTGADRIMKPVAESVRGLQMIHDFSDMNLVTDLKTVENEVQKVISQLKDSVKQGEIRKKWNNLKAEIKSLEAWLQQVSTVNQNLVISGSNKLADVGAPFVKLTAIGDLKFDVKTKTEVLMELISLFIKDQATLDKLTEAKGTLEILQSLDLEFSKFHKSFNDAPDKFQALYVFIGNFFTIASSALQAESSTLNAIMMTTAEGAMYILEMTIEIFITAIVTAICCPLLIVLIVCRLHPKCYWKKKVEEKKKNRLRKLKEHAEKKEKERLLRKLKEHVASISTPALDTNPNNIKSHQDVICPIRKVSLRQEYTPPGTEELPPNPDAPVVPQAPSLMTAIPNTEESLKTARERKGLDRVSGHQNMAVPGQVTNWIKDALFVTDREMVETHSGSMNTLSTTFSTLMNKEKEACDNYLPMEKRRGSKNACRFQTRVTPLRLEGENTDLAIHANLITSPRTGKRFIPTQAPIGNDEELNGKVDTRGDFWMMAFIQGCKCIVMLCKMKERKGKKEVTKCGKYYCDDPGESIECGRFKVKTLSKSEGWVGFKTNEFIYRRLEVTDKEGILETRIYDHYQAVGWPDGNIPTNYGPDFLYKLVNRVTEGADNSPIIVHCSSGIGRTMVFIGMHVIPEAVAHGETKTIAQAITLLRECRFNAVQTVRQSIFLQNAVTYRFCIWYRIDLKYYNSPYERLRDVSANVLERLGNDFYIKYFTENGIPIHNEDKAGF
ncbi:hypothetical protein GCK72_003410 [Caenorhabditis remanei]|uniref:Tyrosine-protein phosphatase domain-containing protein n=1 Tax=Caenorhabditis remanei TaxID=31234 RepID=A0A6A5HY72_CAERE|nr:hypothetical protein GCK72_003410 [Caenorhabditis remanei]KAF1771583.1 hypothetical protein GCK72_003410 [Caenorhabditis remanei]